MMGWNAKSGNVFQGYPWTWQSPNRCSSCKVVDQECISGRGVKHMDRYPRQVDDWKAQ